MSITGSDENSPTKVGAALVDVISGLHAALGISAALVSRANSGVGQKIEINLLSSALSAMVNQSAAVAGAGVTPKLWGMHIQALHLTKFIKQRSALNYRGWQ